MISTYLSGIEQEVVSLLVERCVEIDLRHRQKIKETNIIKKISLLIFDK